jgi:hypothetical protein
LNRGLRRSRNASIPSPRSSLAKASAAIMSEVGHAVPLGVPVEPKPLENCGDPPLGPPKRTAPSVIVAKPTSPAVQTLFGASRLPR